MRRKPQFIRAFDFEFVFDVERSLPGLAVGPDRYVVYSLLVTAEIEPGGGDGWNEPRYPTSASCTGVTVRSAQIYEGDSRCPMLALGSIGPAEPDVAWPSHRFDLTPEEDAGGIGPSARSAGAGRSR